MVDRKIGIFEDKCPKCRSEDLHYDVYEPIEDQLKQEVSCNNCECSFAIWANKPSEWEIWANENFFHIECRGDIVENNNS